MLLRHKLYFRQVIVQTAPCLVIPINFLSPTLKKKFTNSLISDFSSWFEILVFRVDKSNAEIQKVLFIDFVYFFSMEVT